MKRKKFLFLCIITIIIIGLTGCTSKQKSNINEKLDAEISYIEDLIIKIANKYAKKEYEENNKINFDYIKDDIIRINDSWSRLILDLTEVNTTNEEIFEFSNQLNNLIISVGQEDEKKLIDNLSKIYSQLMNFKSSYTDNKNSIEKNELKKDVFEVFNLINNSKYDEANIQIDSTIKRYRDLMNDNDYVKENSYNLNKIYILLQDLKKSLLTENFDLISIKYINLIENI